MTSQRLVEDFARWLWERDQDLHIGELLSAAQRARVPDSYMNEAAVFLAGETDCGWRFETGSPCLLPAGHNGSHQGWHQKTPPVPEDGGELGIHDTGGAS